MEARLLLQVLGSKMKLDLTKSAEVLNPVDMINKFICVRLIWVSSRPPLELNSVAWCVPSAESGEISKMLSHDLK